jgi:protein required for attachment to host cells
MKIILKIFLLTLFFSVVIFYINYNFFLIKEKQIETNVAEQLYIDKTIITKNILSKKEKEELKKYLKQISFYKIKYNPNNLKDKTIFFKNDLKLILDNKIFKNKIKNLIIELNEKKYDRR